MDRTTSKRRYRVFPTLAALGLLVGVFGGLASGAIPNSNDGKIYACYQKANPDKGDLRLIDNEKGDHCTSKELPISWKPQGAPGTNGTNGFSTLIKQTPEAPGANCANGGTKIQSGLDNGAGGGTAHDGTLQSGEVSATGYACNGAPGQSGVTTNCISFPHLEIDWHGCDLRRANLNNAMLKSADLSGANLSGATLEFAFMFGANLTGADLSLADLLGAELTNAILSSANLTDAVLTNANLSNAVLIGANLNGAVFSGANLEFANLTGADLTNADLSNADLAAADLTGVTWSSTLCPDLSNSATNGTSPESCIGHL
jgi:hypothetical protein